MLFEGNISFPVAKWLPNKVGTKNYKESCCEPQSSVSHAIPDVEYDPENRNTEAGYSQQGQEDPHYFAVVAYLKGEIFCIHD